MSIDFVSLGVSHAASSTFASALPTMANNALRSAKLLRGRFKSINVLYIWRALRTPSPYASEDERQIAELLLSRLGKLD